MSAAPLPIALAEVLARGDVWCGDTLASLPEATIPSGHPELDAELPGGGWPRGNLTEFLVDRGGLGELSLLLPALGAIVGRRRLAGAGGAALAAACAVLGGGRGGSGTAGRRACRPAGGMVPGAVAGQRRLCRRPGLAAGRPRCAGLAPSAGGRREAAGFCLFMAVDRNSRQPVAGAAAHRAGRRRGRFELAHTQAPRPAGGTAADSAHSPSRENEPCCGWPCTFPCCRSKRCPCGARLAPSSRAAGCGPATGRRQRPGSLSGTSCRRHSACSPDSPFSSVTRRWNAVRWRASPAGPDGSRRPSASHRRPACCWKSAAACACSAGRRPLSMPCWPGVPNRRIPSPGRRRRRRSLRAGWHRPATARFIRRRWPCRRRSPICPVPCPTGRSKCQHGWRPSACVVSATWLRCRQPACAGASAMARLTTCCVPGAICPTRKSRSPFPKNSPVISNCRPASSMPRRWPSPGSGCSRR